MQISPRAYRILMRYQWPLAGASLAALLLTLAAGVWFWRLWAPWPAAAAPTPASAPAGAWLQHQLGVLQARLQALEAQRDYLIKASGLGFASPELNGATKTPAPENPATPAGNTPRASLEALGQKIAFLQDDFALLAQASAAQHGRSLALPIRAPLGVYTPSSGFGWRRNPVSARYAMHQGADLAAPLGTQIRATAGGLVVRAARSAGYGLMVEIEHGNGLRSRYAHAARLLVRAGDLVRAGAPIALVGASGRATGAHLHFEVHAAGHALDPRLLLAQESNYAPRFALR